MSGKDPFPSTPAGVVMMSGLPASGKTTTAMRLHAYAGGVLIRSCDVYQALRISLPEWVKRTRGFTVNVAAYQRLRDRAYREMARRLAESLASRVAFVILDAVHGEPDKRQAVYEICQAHGVTPVLLVCRCEELREVDRRFRARQGREAQPEREASDLSVFHDIRRRWRDPHADRLPDGRPVPMVTYDTQYGELTIRGDMLIRLTPNTPMGRALSVARPEFPKTGPGSGVVAVPKPRLHVRMTAGRSVPGLSHPRIRAAAPQTLREGRAWGPQTPVATGPYHRLYVSESTG